METIARIGTLFKKDIGERLFENLVAIYPSGLTGNANHAFWALLPVDDPHVEQILKILKAAGFTPWEDHTRGPDRSREFTLQYRRKYDARDLAPMDYLELCPDSEMHIPDSPRREDGLIRLLGGRLNEKVDVGFTMPTCYVVPDRVKRVLEASGLIGLQFRPTLLLPGRSSTASTQPISWERHGPPWWELDATPTMPPLSDSMTFTDGNGRPLKERDFSNGFQRREGFYMRAELHYRATDLANLEPFDVARTFEPFGNRKGYDRLDCDIVVSKRFYDFCRQSGLNVGCVPVRVDCC